MCTSDSKLGKNLWCSRINGQQFVESVKETTEKTDSMKEVDIETFWNKVWDKDSHSHDHSQDGGHHKKDDDDHLRGKHGKKGCYSKKIKFLGIEMKRHHVRA